MFIHFDMIHERDRHTHTRTPDDDIGRAYASHCVAKTIVYSLSDVGVCLGTSRVFLFILQYHCGIHESLARHVCASYCAIDFLSL